MSGTRRLQRSIRVSVASSLLSIATVVVFFAVATATWVSAAAIFAILAGAASSRIVHSEVIQTRAEAARERAAQARAFGEAISVKHAEHAEYVDLMSTRLADRNRTISELTGTIRLAELRAAAAEERLKRESRRANEAQERLATLLKVAMPDATSSESSRLQPHRPGPATQVEPSTMATRQLSHS